MGKAFVQFLILAIVFFGVWLGLSNIDYVKRLHLQELSSKTETKIGNLIMQTIKQRNREIETDSVTQVLDQVKTRLCRNNGIDPKDLHLHLISSAEVNAFALPGNHIVIYTGLINQCDSVEELCGVLSHEIGHLQLHHVMKRIVNELGIGVVAAVASNGNSAVVAQIIKILSSTAFERKQESEADAKGVEYLQRAHIDPHAFAGFMLKIANMKADMPHQMEWISTHPDSKKRAETILALINKKPSVSYSLVITDDSWQSLKDDAEEL